MFLNFMKKIFVDFMITFLYQLTQINILSNYLLNFIFLTNILFMRSILNF